MRFLRSFTAVSALVVLAACSPTTSGMGGPSATIAAAAPTGALQCTTPRDGQGVVMVTFDDGDASQFAAVRQIPCSTWFINTDYIDTGNTWYVSSAQIRSAASLGVEIGCHNATHDSMPGLSPTEMAAQIARCTQAITSWTGRRPTVFAVPYGDTSAGVNAAIVRGGYTVNAIVDNGPFVMGPPLTIPTRIDVGGLSVADVCAEVEQAAAERYQVVLLFHQIGVDTSQRDFNTILGCIANATASGRVALTQLGRFY